MTKKRKIEDDELVEITGAGEFEPIEEPPKDRPAPPGGSTNAPEEDHVTGGNQEFGE